MVALADAQAPGEVVHPERGAEHARETTVDHASAREHGYEERQHAHEVWRVLERALAFVERLVDQPELALLQVAEAAVHQLRALGAGAGREVVALDQRGAQTPAGGVERDPGAGDASTDDQDVEAFLTESLQRPGPIEEGRSTGWSPGQVTGW